MKNYELLVVGGGPAAITPAKILGKEKKMAVIRPEDHSMIYCAMPYAIEGLISTEKTLKKDELITDAGADLIRDTVTQINFNENKVRLADASELSYEKLILATGAVPFIPPVPGAELKGVKSFKTEKDLKDIQDMISSGTKKAVVVGAGAIGIELAQALRDAGLSVDLVDMGSSVLPNLVDSEMTGEIEAEIIKKGIRLHLESKVVALYGKEWVEAVKLDNGDTILFDTQDHFSTETTASHDGIVIFAAGMKPVTDLVQTSGMAIGRDGIIVSEKMETSLSNVYAVGDCAQFNSGITGDVSPGKLATNAVPMAKILGQNMLGQNKTYPGFYNGAATKVGNFYAGGTGLTESAAKKAGYTVITGHSELTTQFPIMPDAKKIRIKLIAQAETMKILGAQIISGEPVTGRIDLFTFAIQKKSTVEDLTALSYSSQPYQSFYPAANGIVLAAEEILRKKVQQ